MTDATLQRALELYEDFILADDYKLDRSVYLGLLGFKAQRLVSFLKEISFQEASFGNRSPYEFHGKVADELEMYWEEELKDGSWAPAMASFLEGVKALELQEEWPMTTISSEDFHLISQEFFKDFLKAKEDFNFRDRLVFRHFTELNLGTYHSATGDGANVEVRTAAKSALAEICRLRDELHFSFSLEKLRAYIQKSEDFYHNRRAEAQGRLRAKHFERWLTVEEVRALGDNLEAEVLWFESTAT